MGEQRMPKGKFFSKRISKDFGISLVNVMPILLLFKIKSSIIESGFLAFISNVVDWFSCWKFLITADKKYIAIVSTVEIVICFYGFL